VCQKQTLELFLYERSYKHSGLYRYAGECFGDYVTRAVWRSGYMVPDRVDLVKQDKSSQAGDQFNSINLASTLS
jgi:hypothetical protein